MKTVLPILIVFALLPSVAGAHQPLTIYCEECRDLTRHPEDARNFSYNQVFGATAWLTTDMADRFRIIDSFGTTVTIDINIEYRPNNLARALEILGSRVIQFEAVRRLLVDDMIIQIRVIYRNLDIVTYTFTLEDVQGDLPVGESNTRSGRSAGGEGGEGGGFNDGADYERDDDDGGGGDGSDEFVCELCTLQVIYPDGSVGDPVDLWTEEEWEEIWEL